MQLTDFPPENEYPPVLSFLHTSVHPRRDEAYFWKGQNLLALDLRTLALSSLFQLDPTVPGPPTPASALTARWSARGVP